MDCTLKKKPGNKITVDAYSGEKKKSTGWFTQITGAVGTG